MKPTLRLLISTLTAISVVIVAATVIAIASTLYSNIATKLGETYARQLGLTGLNEVESYFDDQYQIMSNSPASFGQLPRLPLTRDDPNIDSDVMCSIMKNLFRMSNFLLRTYTIVFDDGGRSSIFLTNLTNGTRVFRCVTFNVYGLTPNTRLTSRTNLLSTTFDIATNFQYDDAAVFGLPGSYNYLFNPDDAGDNLVEYVTRLNDRVGWWNIPAAYREGPNEDVILLYPFAQSVFNSTGHYVGFMYASISIAALSTFLKSLEYNHPNSHSFVIDTQNKEWILATSHPDPPREIRYQDPSLPVSEECTSSNDIESYPVAGVICKIRPGDFNYAPLRSLVESNRTVFARASSFEVEIDVPGSGTYLVSANQARVDGRFFNIMVVFFTYFDEIVSDIVSSTNIVIGIGVAILVAGVAVSVACVIAVLSPLEVVAENMNETSQLRLANQDNIVSDSSIFEIYALQKAYGNMHLQLDSFQRYVPSEIIRNLLANGKEFKTGVYPTYATMLCSDIQSFTSICERCPDPSDLARALQVYFEQVSAIVMSHDGLIVQYIGDAVFAAFSSLQTTEHQHTKACVAALMMNRETCLPTLEKAFDDIGERLFVRIGVNSGQVLCGTIGAQSRIAYTVLGPASDMASNLEAANKQFKTKIMIGSTVAEEVQKFFCLRNLGFYDSSHNGFGSGGGAGNNSNNVYGKSSDSNNSNNINNMNSLSENSGGGGGGGGGGVDAALGSSGSIITATPATKQQANESVFELVGLLPLTDDDLDFLRESKKKRVNVFEQQQKHLSTSLTLKYQNNNNSNGNSNNASAARDVEMVPSAAIQMPTENSSSSNNNNNNQYASADLHGDESPNYSSGGLHRETSFRSEASTGSGRSSATGASDDETIVSTLSSALRKKDGDGNNKRRKGGKKKIRLSARALYETAMNASSCSIVAGSNEVDFCREFNWLVNHWNFSQEENCPSFMKDMARAPSTNTSPAANTIENNAYDKNTNSNTNINNNNSVEPSPSESTEGLSSSVASSNTPLGDNNSGTTTAAGRSADSAIHTVAYSLQENNNNNSNSNTSSSTTPTLNNNNINKKPALSASSSSSPTTVVSGYSNSTRLQIEEVVKILENLKSRFPGYFQIVEQDVKRFARESRCPACYMYTDAIVEKIFGREVCLKIFPELIKS